MLISEDWAVLGQKKMSIVISKVKGKGSAFKPVHCKIYLQDLNATNLI